MNKSDSKYFHTALLMNEALLLLLEKKEFEFITVKEVCEKAGVHRTTFYLHYNDMNDLLIETIEGVNKKFHASFNHKKFNVTTASKEDSYFITEEYLIPYLNFVKNNKRLFKLIHDKPYLFHNKKTLQEMYQQTFTFILDKYKVKDKDKIYIFSFFSQGTLAIILKWVEKDCKEEVEYISNFIIQLVESSL